MLTSYGITGIIQISPSTYRCPASRSQPRPSGNVFTQCEALQCLPGVIIVVRARRGKGVGFSVTRVLINSIVSVTTDDLSRYSSCRKAPPFPLSARTRDSSPGLDLVQDSESRAPNHGHGHRSRSRVIY